jgi:hypothetical protein
MKTEEDWKPTFDSPLHLVCQKNEVKRTKEKRERERERERDVCLL